MLKGFAGAAVQTTLTAGISNSATSFTLADATGWSFWDPFVVVLSRGEANEEKVLCSGFGMGSTVLVEQRGYDGTTAQAHSAGAEAMHVLDAVTVTELVDRSFHLLDEVTASGVSNTVGTCRFANIPPGYERLFIAAPYINHDTTNSGHLYFRFNGDSATNYHSHVKYHSSTTDNATNQGSQAQGYAIYSYFYGASSSGRATRFEMDIWQRSGQRPTVWCRSMTPTAATSYPYGTECKTNWNSTADITQIDLFTSVTDNWESGSLFRLYGQKVI